ncbi:rod shape-determining protein MreC [Nocardioides donggukensis]|uniref:Cell shape-determining protein MreC n=1 Tax=Nocardioides donggukensis TaxID=2774019 RepID=A0A927K379_9ACTN|nr:rod shape-determining protein MreC [Nocardioides donggukensis]MBD8868926.1 rod shape-determining protein MreC [Nocardioides donggukensis]
MAARDGHDRGAASREKRWRGLDRLARRDRPSRSLLAVLVLAAATMITLDYRGGDDSPLEPARAWAGEAFGPVEAATAGAVRPFAAVPEWFRSRQDLRDDVARLSSENAELRRTVNGTDLDRNRLAEYDGLTRAASDTGYALVPARVVGYGPGQSFSHTVTIDAGTDAGVRADMTVVNNDGLVGRVVRASSSTATVVLAVDSESVVGGRLGSSMEIGFLRGRGMVGERGRLDLDLVDDSVVANQGDVVSTWGSRGGAPYVSGIPIGKVTAIFSSPRETSRRAVVAPLVDFTALDLVGVVVPPGTDSDRGLVEAGGRDR